MCSLLFESSTIHCMKIVYHIELHLISLIVREDATKSRPEEKWKYPLKIICSQMRCVCLKHTFSFSLRLFGARVRYIFITTNFIYTFHSYLYQLIWVLYHCMQKMLQTQCLTYFNITCNANVPYSRKWKTGQCKNTMKITWAIAIDICMGLTMHGTVHDARCTVHGTRYTMCVFFFFSYTVERRTIFVFVHSRFPEHNSEREEKKG